MNNIYRTVMSTLFTLAGAFSLLVCPGTAYAVDKAGKADAEEASAQKMAHPVFGVMEPQERHDSSSCAYESC